MDHDPRDGTNAPIARPPFPSQISDRDRAALVRWLEGHVRSELPMTPLDEWDHGRLVGRQQILDLIRRTALEGEEL